MFFIKLSVPRKCLFPSINDVGPKISKKKDDKTGRKERDRRERERKCPPIKRNEKSDDTAPTEISNLCRPNCTLVLKDFYLNVFIMF
jgi:hypothetical protein